MIVWLTGLSGAGKTTIGRALVDALDRQGRRTELLDGDDLRAVLSPALGFTHADRDQHVARVAYLAALLARHDVIPVVALISPYREARAAARRLAHGMGVRFLEVHIDAPLAVVAARDVIRTLSARVRRRGPALHRRVGPVRTADRSGPAHPD